MNRQWRGFVLGFSALGSLLLGGILAWVLGVMELGSGDVPVQEKVRGTAENTVFSAPETLQDGSVKSVAESWPDGSDRTVEYFIPAETGKKLTRSVEYFNSGIKRQEILYNMNDSSSTVTLWFAGGSLESRYTEKDGKKNGDYAEFWENGFCKMKGEYRDGKQDGVWYMWSKMGVRLETGRFKMGVQDGLTARWTQEGTRIMTGQYNQGAPSGVWVWYDENGPVETKDYSKEEELTSETKE